MLIGIVGKPNVGKSTFFKALTLADVYIANYPFATIKPNHGMATVKIDCVDKEFGKQCNPRMGSCINHKRFVPVDALDVAGLVPGAHEGLGLGNQFLDDLNQADALIHVIDVSGSTNEKGEPIQALAYDPANDIKFLEQELDYWYLRIMQKGWEKFARATKQSAEELHKAIAKQLSGLRVTEDMAKQVLEKLKFPENILLWTENHLLQLSTELRKKTKPMVIAANKIDVSGAEKNLERLKKTFPEYMIIGCSAESELALREAGKHSLINYVPGEKSFTPVKELNEAQKRALTFIHENILTKFGSTGVQDIINHAVFNLLDHIAIYPGGVNKLEDSEGRCLPDCFLMKRGSTALDFAFRLHTDFGKHFIKAIDVKTKRAVGKDYVLKHLDVMEIVTNK